MNKRLVEKEIVKRKARNEIIRRAENGEALLLYIETIFKYFYKSEFRRTWWDVILAEMLMDIYWGREKRLIVEMPPRHGKTERIVRMFGSYVQGLDRRIKLQYATYSATLSVSTAVDTKEIMESQIYKEIFPDVEFSSKFNAKDYWKLKGGGEFLATSVGGSNTGIGADIFIGDDLLKAADADSKARRDEAYRFYESSGLTRLEGRKAVILIMQRLHEDDVVGRALSKGGLKENGGIWNRLSLPVINEKKEVYRYKHIEVVREPFTPLDSGAMSLEDIEQRKKEMGKVEFRRQYMQDAKVSEAGFFNKEDFREITDLELPEQNLYIIIDPAESREESADDRGIVVVGKSEDAGRVVTTIVMDGARGKWDVYETCKQIITLMLKYPTAQVFIEGAGGGITLETVLKKEIMIYNAKAQSKGKKQIFNGVFLFKPDNKVSKNSIIKLMAAPLEQGYLLFYVGMDKDFKEQLKKELLAFNPERKDNEDNCIDPLSKSFFLKECIPKKPKVAKPKTTIKRHRFMRMKTWGGI